MLPRECTYLHIGKQHNIILKGVCVDENDNNNCILY